MTLICPVIVGRDAELARLDEIVSRLAESDQTGTGLVICREAGIGKSRLVAHLAAQATAAGCTVLQGGATDRGAALAPVQQALLSCPDWQRIPHLTELNGLSALLAHLLPIETTRALEPSPVLLGHAVLRAIAALAGPAVLVIEDLHDADADSVSIAQHLLEQAATVAVSVVVTTRREGPNLPAIEGLRDRVPVMDLERLDKASSRAAAAACLGVTVSEVSERVERLVDTADGLPLLLEDLVAEALAPTATAFADGGTEGGEPSLAVPGRFAALVGRRLAKLDPSARRVVVAAALLGDALVGDVLPTTTGLDPTDVARAVTAAAGAQLLTADGLGFRHALTRSAVFASTPRSELAELARNAISSMPTPPAGLLPTVAELRATAGDPDGAAHTFQEAADNDRAAGARTAAAARLARARNLVQDPGLAADLAVAHVETLVSLGDLDTARSVAGVTGPYVPPSRRADLELALARGAVAVGDTGLSARHLAAATTLLVKDDPRWARAWVVEALVTLAAPTTAESWLPSTLHIAVPKRPTAPTILSLPARPGSWSVGVHGCAISPRPQMRSTVPWSWPTATASPTNGSRRCTSWARSRCSGTSPPSGSSLPAMRHNAPERSSRKRPWTSTCRPRT